MTGLPADHWACSAVLAGSARRISSTHRVTTLEGNTVDGLEERAAGLLQAKPKLSAPQLSEEVQLWAEIEVLDQQLCDTVLYCMLYCILSCTMLIHRG
jgi:hypothetical protein